VISSKSNYFVMMSHLGLRRRRPFSERFFATLNTTILPIITTSIMVVGALFTLSLMYVPRSGHYSNAQYPSLTGMQWIRDKFETKGFQYKAPVPIEQAKVELLQPRRPNPTLLALGRIGGTGLGAILAYRLFPLIEMRLSNFFSGMKDQSIETVPGSNRKEESTEAKFSSAKDNQSRLSGGGGGKD